MPLDPNTFTRKTGEAIQAAVSLASERNHPQVTPEHLLAALLGQPESVVLPVLERVGVVPDDGARPGRRGARPTLAGVRPDPAAPARAPTRTGCSRRPTTERSELGDDYLSTEHVLLAMTKVAGGVGDLLRAARRHPRSGARRAEDRARQPPGDEREPRGPVPGARALRPRPHRGGAAREARPGHRARRGDPARHPGAVPPHEEQPGAHRRARRRQDRDRRGAGAAHRRGRRPREPAQQATHRARHRRHGRGREVPR